MADGTAGLEGVEGEEGGGEGWLRITEMRLAVDRGVGQGKSPGLGGSKGLFGMELVRGWLRIIAR